MCSVFLQIDLGNARIHGTQQQEFEFSTQFYDLVGKKILGLQGLLSELDEDSIDLLCSSYKANPSWSQKVLCS